MDKREIIDTLAKEKKVEEIIRNVDKGNCKDTVALTDLAQDIYLILLQKPEDTIVNAYNNLELNYYISRIVVNNLNSKNSRFYYTYIKPNKDKDPLPDEL